MSSNITTGDPQSEPAVRPVPVPQDDSATDPAFVSPQRLKEAVVEALIPAIERSFFTSAISVIVFSIVLWSNTGLGLLFWILLRIGVSVVCVISVRKVTRSVGSAAETLRTLTLVMGVSGLVWGLLPALVNASTPEWQAVVALWIFGNQSVVTVVSSLSRSVFAAALGTVTIAGPATMAAQAGSFTTILGVLILLGGFYSYSIFDAMHGVTTAALERKLAALTLAEQLDRRQEELSTANEVLMGMAFEDPLTGLPNRRGLMSQVADVHGHANESGWIGFIDLDHFKQINDSFGHRAGDEVLSELARRWRRVLRDDALIARTGGDEFAVVLGDVSASDAQAMGLRMVEALDEPVPLTGTSPVRVSCSIGLTELRLGSPVSGALAEADSALYAVKTRERGGVALHPTLAPIECVEPLPDRRFRSGPARQQIPVKTEG